ncbi:MAG: GNAT family N-acetyltransferase [Pseudomonadota bacterium]
MGDQLVQAVGVAEVATDPDHQGKGIATTLMTDAIAVAKNSLADFLILFGDEPLYARLGFQSKPNRTLTVSMHDVRTGVQESRCDDGLMVMALNDKAWDDTALIDLVGFAF